VRVVSDQESRDFERRAAELAGHVVYDGEFWWLMGRGGQYYLAGPCPGFVDLIYQVIKEVRDGDEVVGLGEV